MEENGLICDIEVLNDDLEWPWRCKRLLRDLAHILEEATLYYRSIKKELDAQLRHNKGDDAAPAPELDEPPTAMGSSREQPVDSPKLQAPQEQESVLSTRQKRLRDIGELVPQKPSSPGSAKKVDHRWCEYDGKNVPHATYFSEKLKRWLIRVRCSKDSPMTRDNRRGLEPLQWCVGAHSAQSEEIQALAKPLNGQTKELVELLLGVLTHNEEWAPDRQLDRDESLDFLVRLLEVQEDRRYVSVALQMLGQAKRFTPAVRLVAARLLDKLQDFTESEASDYYPPIENPGDFSIWLQAYCSALEQDAVTCTTRGDAPTSDLLRWWLVRGCQHLLLSAIEHALLVSPQVVQRAINLLLQNKQHLNFCYYNIRQLSDLVGRMIRKGEMMDLELLTGNLEALLQLRLESGLGALSALEEKTWLMNAVASEENSQSSIGGDPTGHGVSREGTFLLGTEVVHETEIPSSHQKRENSRDVEGDATLVLDAFPRQNCCLPCSTEYLDLPAREEEALMSLLEVEEQIPDTASLNTHQSSVEESLPYLQSDEEEAWTNLLKEESPEPPDYSAQARQDAMAEAYYRQEAYEARHEEIVKVRADVEMESRTLMLLLQLVLRLGYQYDEKTPFFRPRTGHAEPPAWVETLDRYMARFWQSGCDRTERFSAFGTSGKFAPAHYVGKMVLPLTAWAWQWHEQNPKLGRPSWSPVTTWRLLLTPMDKAAVEFQRMVKVPEHPALRCAAFFDAEFSTEEVLARLACEE